MQDRVYNIFQLVRPRLKRYSTWPTPSKQISEKRSERRVKKGSRLWRRGKRNYRTDRLALSYSWLSWGSRLRYTAVYPLSLYLLPFFLLALSTNHRSFFGFTCYLRLYIIFVTIILCIIYVQSFWQLVRSCEPCTSSRSFAQNQKSQFSFRKSIDLLLFPDRFEFVLV